MLCKFKYLDVLLIVSFNTRITSQIAGRDLDGITLNTVAQYDPDYKERISMIVHPDGRLEFTGGMCLEIMLALQTASQNFSFTPVEGKGWGGMSLNGTYFGMVSQIMSGEADISIAQTTMVLSINTYSAVTLLHPTSYGQFVALLRQPKASSNRNLLTSVFTLNSCLFYLLMWSIILLIVFIFSFTQQRKLIRIAQDSTFIKEAVLWAVITSFSLGWYIHPSSSYFRCAFITASLLAYYWYVAFSSEITAGLLTEVHPIRNFDQLAASNLEVTSNRISMTKNIIEKIFDRRDLPPQLASNITKTYSVDVGLQKVIRSSPSIAFVAFADAISTVLHRIGYSDSVFCESVSSIDLASARTPTAMFVKKKSPLKEDLNYNILMMGESGILSRLNKQYDVDTQIRCTPKSNNYRGGLSLEDIKTAFMILTGGFMMCIVSLACERIGKTQL